MPAPDEALDGRVGRRLLRVRGIVQGVGFRPFVLKLASDFGLAGWVRNNEDGVVIEIEGGAAALDGFELMLSASPPPLARIEDVTAFDIEPRGETNFRIVDSEEGRERTALVSADVAVCSECLAEITDPSARRFGYPFTNCTNCGPRFTITIDVPYDRKNTTMAGYAMCSACAAEYGDPRDRRFHAQPIACPACGPKVWLTDPLRNLMGGDPVNEAARLLGEGMVVAVKGIGGWHLAADASNERAVGKLRARKHREDKPFAIMALDLDAARALCDVDETEAALLTGHRRPVVLLRRREGVSLAESVAPKNRYLGVVLAYSPLHHLLLRSFDALVGGQQVLVMTSGNVSDEPIAYSDDDAFARLAEIADYFLFGDRRIHTRCDDSVTRVFRSQEYPIRRARGYAPEPLKLVERSPTDILAVGAELKHTFCLAKGNRAFVSPHIGDLANWETMQSFLVGIEHFARMFDVRPKVVVHDLHPEYLSTKWALEQRDGAHPVWDALDVPSATLMGVQHHHAHIASCLADNGYAGPVIGLALDGTGWGGDGTIWGCELLVADLAGFHRAGHLRTVPLPGGVAAVKEPWRMAAMYLHAAFGGEATELALPFVARNASRWAPVLALAEAGINTWPTSSAGRLFDAASALCGVRERVNYEGQAAIEFEQLVDHRDRSAYPCEVKDTEGSVVIDGVGLFRSMAEDILGGTPRETAAARFHNGIVEGLVTSCVMISQATGLHGVALSGGTFQNLMILERITQRLEQTGFLVYVHRHVPANDGGIAFGQVAIAVARLRS